ncbi:NGP1NT-domain-containing protein [Wallemia mellicola]|uniref:Nucleolar GTP-binding protein 2 n=1 Tax=Wallemia mellicola TaxID=1708541 RepID=A0A4T0RQ90_9BASI|nr:NGP1NT-domain-containing protein [Wallemia mellicola]TIB88438.1 NGP1NT-domain-containing protein [Wallemia mellicola]TIC40545.1 NGP1NT-domain-containing protein [Wallemia mellicola]TIC49037.1 NGP1NT-domain-containing protein [Wallemia mellicola]TIC55081.1 NGP1NT-domain-containing protein [Wallemia mellicola]
MPKDKSSTTKSNGIKKVKGENFYRDAKKASRVKMYTGGKARRDPNGKIIESAAFQKTEKETDMGRVAPDRRWFGNTRVISQDALNHFRDSLAEKSHDPYSVVLRRNKLPMGLIQEPNLGKAKGMAGNHIVDTEPFSDTFGPGAQRKRPNLDVSSFEELGKSGAGARTEDQLEADAPTPSLDDIKNVNKSKPAVSLGVDQVDQDQIPFDLGDLRNSNREAAYRKGTSKRIWAELYKVIDSSDVIIHVLDSRDPEGTLCNSVLETVRKERSHKQVILVINKVDLVPTWVTAKWVKHLSRTYPTLAMHSNINNSFGKGALIQLLRQFSVLHSDKKQISVGLIGYPNVGKSSIINTLKKKKVCNVAPIPGETKVWQYVSLMKRIYMIDCPGIVPVSKGDSDTDTVLKGVVRVENLATPPEHIGELLKRVRHEYLERTYQITKPTDGVWEGERGTEDVLQKIAKRTGKLLRGGEPDQNAAAKMVLNDWIRGKIPFFTAPPGIDADPVIKTLPEEPQVKPADWKGKGKATEHDEQEDIPSKQLKGVSQPIKQIPVATKFLPDDVKGHEDAFENDNEGELADADADDAIALNEEDDSEEEEEYEEPALEEIGWDEVFNNGEVAESASEDEQPKKVNFASDDEDQPKKTKEPRKTTSKAKKTNYYTTANVKNKNKNKQKPEPPSEEIEKKKRKSGSLHHLQNKIKRDSDNQAYLKLWIDLLKELKDLGLDDKEEVRLGTISTLFQSLDFYGHTLSSQSWEQIIWDVIIPLLDNTLSSGWHESLTLALDSTASLFKNYLHSNIKHLESFNKLWKHLCDILEQVMLVADNQLVSSTLKAFISIEEVFKQEELDNDIYQVSWNTSLKSFDIIKSTDSQFAQEGLELLLRFIKYHYDSQGSTWDDNRCVEADTDHLTPLQNQSLKCLASVEEHSDSIMSTVLEIFSEWASFAYDNDLVLNSRVSFVALSKHIMGNFTSYVRQYCLTGKKVITSSSLRASLIALSIPLRIKYSCPPASKRDDITLWEIAQDHYCEYTHVVLEILQQQKSIMEDDEQMNIIICLIEIMRDSFKVDRRLAMNEPLERQARWEKHEVKLIDNFKDTLLPQLRNRNVPETLIDELIGVLCNATYPYLNPEDYKYGSLIEETTSPVERLSYYLFDVLFDICEEKLDLLDLVPIVQKHIISRCIASFERYCCDRDIRGVDGTR